MSKQATSKQATVQYKEVTDLQRVTKHYSTIGGKLEEVRVISNPNDYKQAQVFTKTMSKGKSKGGVYYIVKASDYKAPVRSTKSKEQVASDTIKAMLASGKTQAQVFKYLKSLS